MKIVKLLIATVALSGALVTSAHARDSFSIGINIGGNDFYAPQTIRTHRHIDHYRGYYRSAPRVIYYTPQIRYRHFRGGSYFGNRDFGHARRGGHHYRGQRFDRQARRHNRRHENRGRGNGRGWR